MPTVLNIGGGPRGISLPSHFSGWDEVRLDIDESAEPDLLMDARDLGTLPGGTYDAVYGSHILEHFWHHELGDVLHGVYHVLRRHGFAQFRIPDAGAACRAVVERGLDAVLYTSDAGPILARDVLWGFVPYVRQYGDPYGHRTGFTASSLNAALRECGFASIYAAANGYELGVVAGKSTLSVEYKNLLGIMDRQPAMAE